MSRDGNLFLVKYTGTINEKKLNWGYSDNYFVEDKLPVSFIYSNFPQVAVTNKQSLMGTIRTHVEERKGIIFFPSTMEEDVKEYIRAALRIEKIQLEFLPYSGDKYNADYLSQICDICFSIKNINLQEVIKMAQLNLPARNSYQELIKKIGEIEDKEVTCFILDKEEGKLIESLHLDINPSPKKKGSFADIVKEKAFKTQFFDLFIGKDSAVEQIKFFYQTKDWKFHSLLIFYSIKHKILFIQDSPKSAFFLTTSDTTFMSLNTHYSLISYNYESKPYQQISITKNDINERFDILVDGKIIESPTRKRDIMAIFPLHIESINQFLQMITDTKLNEFRFYYDKMVVFVKITGNKYIIDTYEAK